MTESEASKHLANQNSSGKSTVAGSTGVAPIGGMIQRESQDFLKNFAGTHLPFPQLTEEEKQSPLGVSMVYVMGLFSSLSQHMVNERRNEMNNSSQQPNQFSMTAAVSQPSHPSSSSMPPPANVTTTRATTEIATNACLTDQQGVAGNQNDSQYPGM